MSALSMMFSTVAHANDDTLGAFLEQNFPAIHAADTSDDPIRAFANQLPQQNVAFQPAVSNAPFNTYGASSYAYGPLLNAQSALIMNANTGKVLYQKNMDSVRSIASISKLMSAMVLLDANLNMNEPITITEAEIDRLKGTGSRLSIGTTLTRGELLHISLMSSENRATHALGRTYPGGMGAFVAAMNAKAQSLGMNSTRFYEPTGLDPRNVSTARDLSVMVRAASNYATIRSLSTSNYGSVYTSNGRLQSYKNTNSLVREGVWDITLQKTGYIREAGRSMVVQANLDNQPMIIVVLGASTTSNRVSDAHRLSSVIRQTPL
ncbi:D-alanyl-D-alanine carboxypeptidase family protein [Alysiella filiformis]